MDTAHPVKWRLVPVFSRQGSRVPVSPQTAGRSWGLCTCSQLSPSFPDPCPAARLPQRPCPHWECWLSCPAPSPSKRPRPGPSLIPGAQVTGPLPPTAPPLQAGSQKCLFPGVALPEPSRPLTRAAPAAWRPGHLCPLLLPPASCMPGFGLQCIPSNLILCPG